MKVLLGYDSKEWRAHDVACWSIQSHDRRQRVEPIILSNLQNRNLYVRPTTTRNRQLYDDISEAPMSSEFAISRFFVPFLTTASDEWALFMDGDIVALSPVSEVLGEANTDFAIQVVKHALPYEISTKKVNKVNLPYPRKNWSSVMLWNLRHPAHRHLTPDVLNSVSGLNLHNFCWLDDDEIGDLSPGWNWLVNVEPRPDPCHVAHFTLGGPWLPGWESAPNDEIWVEASRG